MGVLNFSSLDGLLVQTEPVLQRYPLYKGEIELIYDPEEHEYFREINGERVRVLGVTSITSSADKPALKPWVAKENADATLNAIMEYIRHDTHMIEIDVDDFFDLVKACKTAYKDKTEKACDVGHIAHEFIEDYLKAKKAGDAYAMQVLINDISARVLRKVPLDAFERQDAVEQATKCCFNAVAWLEAHNFRPILTEYKLYSVEFNYAGTTDSKGRMDSCSDPECCSFQFKDWLVIADWKSSRDMYIEYRYQSAAYDKADEEESGDVKDARVVVELGKYTGIVEGHILTREDLDDDFAAFLGLMVHYERLQALEAIHKQGVAERKAIRAEKKAAKEAEAEAKRQAKALAREQKALEAALKPKRKKKEAVQ